MKRLLATAVFGLMCTALAIAQDKGQQDRDRPSHEASESHETSAPHETGSGHETSGGYDHAEAQRTFDNNKANADALRDALSKDPNRRDPDIPKDSNDGRFPLSDHSSLGGWIEHDHSGGGVDFKSNFNDTGQTPDTDTPTDTPAENTSNRERGGDHGQR